MTPDSRATVLNNISFDIEPVRILREMRIPKLSKLSELKEKPLADAIKLAIDRGYTLIQGKGVYKTYQLTNAKDGYPTGPALDDLFSSDKIAKILSDCDYVTLLVSTIGPALETEVEKLQDKGDLTGAYALEMVGGWMADYMADRIDDMIVPKITKAGYERTMRFSPGYGEWPLKTQEKLLPLAEADKIGVTLTDTDIMIPRKSVSAVIGWRTCEVG